ncbi:MAG: hypothetical protein U9Q62_01540 [Campylobacterota bacterium]|nr:hypothetical protein [Campylobacterota bacterium]
MIRALLIIAVLSSFAAAKEITENEVYAQVRLIQEHVHVLHRYFELDHLHADEGTDQQQMKTELKPRNVWQKSYEIMVKINLLREENKLPFIEPVNMMPVLNLNPDLVYEQTQRILTELKIFQLRMGIKSPTLKQQTFRGKTSLDVFNGLSHISTSLDELNKGGVTPSFVFAENMRLNDDITLILQHLEIADKTIPDTKNISDTPEDAFNEGMKILEKIKQLQIAAGIDFVDFSGFKKEKPTPSDVFSITQMIIAELQTLKAYVGLRAVTPAATKYKTKTPAEVTQLMSWNLRKLSLIHSLNKGR